MGSPWGWTQIVGSGSVEGISPNDTSWEDWGSLKTAYHLEDKVLFDEGGDVKKGIMHQPGTTGTSMN